MEFSRQEYWSGLPFPSPGDLPDPGIKPGSPALQADTLPSEPPCLSLEWWVKIILGMILFPIKQNKHIIFHVCAFLYERGESMEKFKPSYWYWLLAQEDGMKMSIDFSFPLYISLMFDKILHTTVYKINKVLLHSPGNYIQYLIINYNRKESEKEWIYIYIYIYIYM